MAARSVVVAIFGALTLIAISSLAATLAAQAQTPPQNPPGPPGPPPPRFPAQLRPPSDPELVARGKRVYEISCRGCHGADLRGGDMGGPNLLRSDVMLNDDQGERLRPILQGARPRMPPVDLPPNDVTAVAVYIHSVLAQGRAQGAPPAAAPPAVNIVVGDASQGEVFFTEQCSSCHSVTGDLQGIASRVAEPMELQNLWVAGGRQEPRNPGGPGDPGDIDRPSTRRDVTVIVSPPTGAPIEGRLERIDDFSVSLVTRNGVRQTIRRIGDVPKVEIRDPLSTHKRLLLTYTDRELHNVTAYLVTLK
jgi:cytochrome c oxidase cbb3-type subunit III